MCGTKHGTFLSMLMQVVFDKGLRANHAAGLWQHLTYIRRTEARIKSEPVLEIEFWTSIRKTSRKSKSVPVVCLRCRAHVHIEPAALCAMKRCACGAMLFLHLAKHTWNICLYVIYIYIYICIYTHVYVHTVV